MFRRLFLASAALVALASQAGADTYIGDSIALGAGHAAGAPTMARVGAGSCEIAGKVPSGLLGWVIVSAGVNDAGACVREVRTAIGQNATVIWIMPPVKYRDARTAITMASMEHGDRFVTYIPGKDGLHPRSYPELVRAIEATK
jgi:hypothetical protein